MKSCSSSQRYSKILRLFSVLLVWLALGGGVRAEEEGEVDEEVVWKSAGTNELYRFLKCDQDRPDSESLEVHSMETWAYLQKMYTQTIDEDENSLPEGTSVGLDGFYVPYKVDHGEHGRGIFVTEDVAEGSLIWRSFNTARFPDGDAFRAYLRTLPPHLACDVLHWAYTRFDDEDYPMVCLDLDPGSFTNDCSWGHECNMVLSEETKEDTGCELEFYAGTDIPKGTELRIDYEFSSKDDGWIALGLFRGHGLDAPQAAVIRQKRLAARRAKEAELAALAEEEEEEEYDEEEEEEEEEEYDEEEEEEEDDEEEEEDSEDEEDSDDDEEDEGEESETDDETKPKRWFELWPRRQKATEEL